MNQIIYNILIVYGIASIIYIVYLIYLYLSKAETVHSIIQSSPEMLEKFKNINRNHMMIFIIGVLIGLIILILFQNDTKDVIKNINRIPVISDVSDIYVQ